MMTKNAMKKAIENDDAAHLYGKLFVEAVAKQLSQ